MDDPLIRLLPVEGAIHLVQQRRGRTEAVARARQLGLLRQPGRPTQG